MIIIDRFEGEYAVCEDDEKQVLIEKSKLLSNAKEGDVLEKTPQGYVVNVAETEIRREKINALQNDLWE